MKMMKGFTKTLALLTTVLCAVSGRPPRTSYFNPWNADGTPNGWICRFCVHKIVVNRWDRKFCRTKSCGTERHTMDTQFNMMNPMSNDTSYSRRYPASRPNPQSDTSYSRSVQSVQRTQPEHEDLACKRCTFINKPNWSRCEMCRTAKPVHAPRSSGSSQGEIGLPVPPATIPGYNVMYGNAASQASPKRYSKSPVTREKERNPSARRTSVSRPRTSSRRWNRSAANRRDSFSSNGPRRTEYTSSRNTVSWQEFSPATPSAAGKRNPAHSGVGGYSPPPAHNAQGNSALGSRDYAVYHSSKVRLRGLGKPHDGLTGTVIDNPMLYDVDKSKRWAVRLETGKEVSVQKRNLEPVSTASCHQLVSKACGPTSSACPTPGRWNQRPGWKDPKEYNTVPPNVKQGSSAPIPGRRTRGGPGWVRTSGYNGSLENY